MGNKNSGRKKGDGLGCKRPSSNMITIYLYIPDDDTLKPCAYQTKASANSRATINSGDVVEVDYIPYRLWKESKQMQRTSIKYVIKYLNNEYMTPKGRYWEWCGSEDLSNARLFTTAKNAKSSIQASVPRNHQPHCVVVPVTCILCDCGD